MFDDAADDILSRREKNMKEFEEFMSDYFNSEEGKEAKIICDKLRDSTKHKNTFVKRKKRKSDVFYTKVRIPLERRSSLRLKNKQPYYTYDDLPSENTLSRQLRNASGNDDWSDLEAVVYEPARKRASLSNKPNNYVYVPVEDVTDDYISKVALNSTKKVYCTNFGTSCHQCRQKTLDSKTYCRNISCLGVRGQFCGPCLRNRYGEEVAVALKDPNWHCPVCKGICNCSFCRNKLGKRPTGILAPIAQKNGHASVHHLLQDLNGFGDYANEYTIEKVDHNHEICLLEVNNDQTDNPLLGFCEKIWQPIYIHLLDVINIIEKRVLKEIERDVTEMETSLLIGFDENLQPVVY